MKRLLNYVKIKNILSFLSREMIITVSELQYNSQISFKDIIKNWERRIENGKILTGNEEIKKDFSNIFGITKDLNNMIIETGYEILRRKINIIDQILNLNIKTSDKIDLINFLISKSSDELTDEYLN